MERHTKTGHVTDHQDGSTGNRRVSAMVIGHLKESCVDISAAFSLTVEHKLEVASIGTDSYDGEKEKAGEGGGGERGGEKED